ncbi:MAG: PAS domain S-box protein [Verrucomicrobiota bacterium]|nr:PAS domain S-box protein [Verrucomicrobiota bacterium]
MVHQQQQLRVLVVDDSADDAFILLNELKRGGFEVVGHRTSRLADALNLLAQQPYDLVLTDFDLQGEVGLEVIKGIRERFADIPIIMLSGTVNEQTGIIALEQGAQDYVGKDHLERLVPAVERELKVRKKIKHQEVTLLQTQERYMHMVENSSDLVAEIDESGVILAASPTHKTLIGFDPADLVGKSVFELIHPEDLELVRKALQERAARVTFRLICADKSYRWFESSRQLFRTSSGEERAVVISRDMTEMRQAHERLATSEAKFRAIFESAALGMMVVDNHGSILQVNGAIERVLGYGEEELIGKCFLDLSLSPEEAGEDQLFQELTHAGFSSYTVEKRYRRKDGAIIWVNLSASFFQVSQDSQPQFILMFEDTTERKQYAQRISEQAELLDLAQDAIIVRDLNDRIKFWNKGAERVYGFRSDEAIGHH